MNNHSKNRFWTIGQYVLIAIFDVGLLLLSLYFLWGWITVSDIRAQCEKNGYDAEKAFTSMLSESESIRTNAGDRTSHSVLGIKDDSLFKRLKIGETMSMSAVRNATNHFGQLEIEEYVIKIGYLDPFFRVSENVVNAIFTFGAGYIMSSVLVALALLQEKHLTRTFLILRPLVGAMVSVCLFVVVLSGGRILWEGAAHPNGLSVGIIAAIGSVYCERFEKMLQKSIPPHGNMQAADGPPPP